MIKFNDKEKRILSITLASFGVVSICSGLIMNAQVKTIVNTKYTLTVKTQKIAETQAKTNEIKVKNLEVETNTPISVDIKDYLEEADTISPNVLKNLKLDTSLVNITQAGTYQYTVLYGKKKYVGTIKIKDKELPKINFTLKPTIKITTSGTIPTDKRYYINEEITDEVYNNIILDISEVVQHQKQPGIYTYTITYLDTKYQGKIEIVNDVITKTCPNDATKTNDNQCICSDNNKEYDEASNTCKDKNTNQQGTTGTTPTT